MASTTDSTPQRPGSRCGGLVEIAVWRGTAWLLPGAAGDLLFALLFLRWLRAHPVRVPT